MMNGPAQCRQLDLLMHTVKANELDRISPATRTEVMRLLKRLISEYTGAGTVPPVEAATDE